MIRRFLHFLVGCIQSTEIRVEGSEIPSLVQCERWMLHRGPHRFPGEDPLVVWDPWGGRT